MASKLSYSRSRADLISKNAIKQVRALHRKRNRDAEGLFIVEGEKMVWELAHSDFEIQSIFHLEGAKPQNCKTANVFLTSAKEMTQITQLSSPSPVLAVAIQKKHDAGLLAWSQERVLVLDSIRDPGNLGAIIRSADWFGIQHVLASPDTVDVYNPKVVQASMGSVFRIAVAYAELNVLKEMKDDNSEFQVFGALLSGQSMDSLGKAERSGALIIGNESVGISDSVQELIDEAVTIPRIGEAESLNAAVSAGILLYAWSERS